MHLGDERRRKKHAGAHTQRAVITLKAPNWCNTPPPPLYTPHALSVKCQHASLSPCHSSLLLYMPSLPLSFLLSFALPFTRSLLCPLSCGVCLLCSSCLPLPLLSALSPSRPLSIPFFCPPSLPLATLCDSFTCHCLVIVVSLLIC